MQLSPGRFENYLYFVLGHGQRFFKILPSEGVPCKKLAPSPSQNFLKPKGTSMAKVMMDLRTNSCSSTFKKRDLGETLFLGPSPTDSLEVGF